MSHVRSVVILGSTGSIGTQALQVIARHRDRFKIVGLAAGGGHVDLLAQQAKEYRVSRLAVANPGAQSELLRKLDEFDIVGADNVHVQSGVESVVDLAGLGADLVLNAITGSVGLRPSIAALQAGSQLVLANKESVVVGGHLLFDSQVRRQQINPVDSEHSAIWQSLRAGTHGEVARLVVTASGGPFRGRTRAQLADVTPKEALNHPTWSMGPVVTINSSTMMNKGLEVIEASRLFHIPDSRIIVSVHPQSVVHSMVEFQDGATICQASPPDMRLPIALGLSAPERLGGVASPCDWSQVSCWTFEPLDEQVFPAVKLARQCLQASEKHTAVLNAANEEAVRAFLERRLSYLSIVDTVRSVIASLEAQLKENPRFESVEEMEWIEGLARREANRLIKMRGE